MYYKEHGFHCLKRRLINFVQLYNEERIPFKAKVLDFGDIEVNTKEELYVRIRELRDILGVPIEISLETMKMENGTIQERKIMKVME